MKAPLSLLSLLFLAVNVCLAQSQAPTEDGETNTKLFRKSTLQEQGQIGNFSYFLSLGLGPAISLPNFTASQFSQNSHKLNFSISTNMSHGLRRYFQNAAFVEFSLAANESYFSYDQEYTVYPDNISYAKHVDFTSHHTVLSLGVGQEFQYKDKMLISGSVSGLYISGSSFHSYEYGELDPNTGQPKEWKKFNQDHRSNRTGFSSKFGFDVKSRLAFIMGRKGGGPFLGVIIRYLGETDIEFEIDSPGILGMPTMLQFGYAFRF